MRILILSIIVFLLGIINFTRPLQTGAHFVFGPVQLGMAEIARNLKDSFRFFSNLSEIRNDNLALMEQNTVLLAEVAELKGEREENKILREQLELKREQEIDVPVVMASVLGNPSDTSGNTVILDKGTGSGIQVGDSVILNKHLVGSITKAYFLRSVVELTSSPSFTATVHDSETRTEGLVKGQYGTNLVMDRILPGEAISEGDIIVTSGKDGFFEPDLVVGIVKSVSNLTADPLITAELEPVVDVGNLNKVFVIIRQ